MNFLAERIPRAIRPRSAQPNLAGSIGSIQKHGREQRPFNS
jgi:hypothetical protein